MPASLNRRAILAGAAATAMPAVALAAVNTSPDHELLKLRPLLLQAHEAMEAAIEAFAAIHDPIDEAAWLEAGVGRGQNLARRRGQVPRGNGEAVRPGAGRIQPAG